VSGSLSRPGGSVGAPDQFEVEPITGVMVPIDDKAQTIKDVPK